MRVVRFSVAALMATGIAAAQSTEDAARRFALAYVAYAPASSIDLRVDARPTTPVGSYLVATAIRSSLKAGDPEQLSLLIDPQSRQITTGALMPLPPSNPPLTSATIPGFVENVLPQMLSGYMGTRVKIRWPSLPTRPTAVVPLTVELLTGYGWTRLPAAITMDGKYFMLGSAWPLERDPRAVRREILRDAPVHWDTSHQSAAVQLVEFSDFQCPACKYHWKTVKEVLGQLGGAVRHGMVNYPLTQSHPWAFAAAVAGECVGRAWPERFFQAKEEFYRLQDSMSVETVKDATLGFLAQQSLPEKPFSDCFMKDPVVDSVLRQIELSQRMGVVGTPTYFANGEILSAGNRDWMHKRLLAIIAAKGLPEQAAEIEAEPPATPAAAGPLRGRPSPPLPQPRRTATAAPAPKGEAPGSEPR